MGCTCGSNYSYLGSTSVHGTSCFLHSLWQARLLPAGAAGAAGTRPQSEETGRDARASLGGVDDSVASRVILRGKEAERRNLSADAEVKSRAVHRELRIRSKS